MKKTPVLDAKVIDCNEGRLIVSLIAKKARGDFQPMPYPVPPPALEYEICLEQHRPTGDVRFFLLTLSEARALAEALAAVAKEKHETQ